MNFQTPLAKARGLGAAGEGSNEWWRQRVTAIALIPLTFWFAAAVAGLPGLEYREAVQWIASPWNGILMLSFIIIVAYHSILGLQVVIEDYVHVDWVKMLALLGTKLVFSFLGLAAVYATFRIIFTN